MQLATRLGVSAAFGLLMALLVRPSLKYGLWFMGTTFEGDVGWWTYLQVAGMLASFVIMLPSLVFALILPYELIGEADNTFVAITTSGFWACFAFLLLAGREWRDRQFEQ